MTWIPLTTPPPPYDPPDGEITVHAVCECGEYRHQHDEGGRCRLCKGSRYGCTGWRFAHLAERRSYGGCNGCPA